MDSFFLHNSCMPSELVFRGRAISEGQSAKENAQGVQKGKYSFSFNFCFTHSIISKSVG